MEHFVTNGTANIWTHITKSQDIDKEFLCLCAGGPGVSDGLSEIDPLLNSNYNIIRFDYRGCGDSTADGKYDIETTIDDIEKIRQFYNIESWYILGHSWGANVALFYALKYPQFCKGIIYLCGAGVQNNDDWHTEFNENAAKMTEPEITLPEDFKINYDVLNYGLCSFKKYIQAPMILKNISVLQVPTLIICGEKDIRPRWTVVQLSNLLPMGTLKILNECGHFPWHTHPDLLKKTIIDWIDNTAK